MIIYLWKLREYVKRSDVQLMLQTTHSQVYRNILTIIDNY
jgi:hypothetical protein